MNIFIDTEDMEERYGEQLYIEYLEKQNKELHNKIDKAIEYLETNGYGYDCCGDMCYFLDEDNQKDLLEILKDSDVDE